MSGVAVIRYLLATDARVLAIIPSRQVVAGDIPLGTPFPSIEVVKISGTPRLTVSMREPNRMQTDRIQVSALFKTAAASPAGAGYPGLDAMMKLLPAVCSNRRGTINGIDVDSILPDIEGPDLPDDVIGFISRTRDFIVKWREAF